MNKFVLIFIVGTLTVSPSVANPATLQKNSRPDSKVTYFKASIPQRIFGCMHHLSLTRCMKLLLLARLEARAAAFHNSGNITSDFMSQIITSADDDRAVPYNFYEVYATSNETEINDRLLRVFRKFFQGREITLHFIPGMIVKVVPSPKDMLEFSLKKSSSGANEARGGGDEVGLLGGGHKDKKGYAHYVQLAVPLFVFPAVLFSSFLPFLIPALKMATMFAGVINNVALLASVMYLARQIAIENEQKQTVYFNPGYNR